MITYEKAHRIACQPAGKGAHETVYLDGKRVGTIYRDGARFYYQPKGSTQRGERLDTVEAVKASLEGDA